MPDKAYLVLEDGSVFEGEAFGAPADAFGEVVFNTSMTGYQEVLTDPSYAGQIVVLTYPLVGNYGINAEDFESRRIQVAALVVREHSTTPSHGASTSTLSEFLASQGIPAISGIDTRAITRRLRTRGVMMGILGHEAPEAALARMGELPRYGDQDFVRRVSTEAPYRWDSQPADAPEARYRVLVTDCGLKYNILRLLRARGCEVLVVPVHTSAEEIMAQRPDGLLLSPGPGDPALLDYVVNTAREVAGRVPTLGICLGHQVVARAFGGKTFKLKFGHRGANHPVKDTATGRVHITAQNHGYAVDPDSLPSVLEVSHINLNDNTVEGLRHRELPIITIQYHSEASPGPRDNEYIFDQFMAMIKVGREVA
ncbi:MAG: glutamine-hydrolyzing carbamoyl-phosphate synthase small subunit [Chloroflexota bacterium]|nr:glutamine-hydrolyzing carbamoyl-phosphate synthase small subunit [Chloroflexota bacterium]